MTDNAVYCGEYRCPTCSDGRVQRRAIEADPPIAAEQTGRDACGHRVEILSVDDTWVRYLFSGPKRPLDRLDRERDVTEQGLAQFLDSLYRHGYAPILEKDDT